MRSGEADLCDVGPWVRCFVQESATASAATFTTCATIRTTPQGQTPESCYANAAQGTGEIQMHQNNGQNLRQVPTSSTTFRTGTSVNETPTAPPHDDTQTLPHRCHVHPPPTLPRMANPCTTSSLLSQIAAHQAAQYKNPHACTSQLRSLPQRQKMSKETHRVRFTSQRTLRLLQHQGRQLCLRLCGLRLQVPL